MVRVEGNKLIIEIKTTAPAENLQNIQNAIIESLQMFNYKDFGEQCPAYDLLELLKETLPTFEEQTYLLK